MDYPISENLIVEELVDTIEDTQEIPQQIAYGEVE